MKIAVLFRGPLRPSAASTRNYIAEFMRNFEDIGVIPSKYLATWHPSSIDDDFCRLIENDIDGLIAISMPSEQLMGSDIYHGELPSWHKTRNLFYQHYMSKIAIDVISSQDEFDLIVHTRTDLSIDFGDKFPEWFVTERRGRYQAMHVRTEHPDSFLNDQFGVGSPETMKAAWNYGSLEQLRNKISSVASAGGRAEDVLQLMLDEAGIDATWGPVVTYSLDAKRHDPPQVDHSSDQSGAPKTDDETLALEGAADRQGWLPPAVGRILGEFSGMLGRRKR